MTGRARIVGGSAAVLVAFGASYLLSQVAFDSDPQAVPPRQTAFPAEALPSSTPPVVPSITLDESPLPELETPTPTPKATQTASPTQSADPTATATQQPNPTATAPPTDDGGGGGGGGGGGAGGGGGGVGGGGGGEG